MPGKEPLKKTRHPSVYQSDKRLVIRWTIQEQGQRNDHIETMPDGATRAEAVGCERSGSRRAGAVPCDRAGRRPLGTTRDRGWRERRPA